jgi:uncharacterized protein YcaQ
MMSTEISSSQAKKLVLLQQNFRTTTYARNKPDLLSCIEQMGYVQIDSISVVARAHHHSLFNRVENYSEQKLADLIADAKVFEYWSHAAAYLPLRDYRYSLVRKQAIKNGEMHWYKPDRKAMAEVLGRIKTDGPLMAKDFKQIEHANSGWWDWKPAKVALEQLFMQGDLMVTQRRGFQKVYDLTERVLPSDTDTRIPSQSEHCRYLILQYLKGNGLAKIEHISYLRKGVKSEVALQLKQLLEEGGIIQVQVNKHFYYALSGIENQLKTRLSQEKLRILSPFDNLLIQRARMRELFKFDYQIECYVPAAKRTYGYFSLPLLQGLKFVGRMDVKMHRKELHMCVQHLHLETENLEKLCQPFVQALKDFMLFQQANSITIERISHLNENYSPVRLQQFQQSILSKL